MSGHPGPDDLGYQLFVQVLLCRYSPGAEDRLDFGPGKRKRKYTSAEAWAYRTYEQLNSSSFTHFGKVGRGTK